MPKLRDRLLAVKVHPIVDENGADADPSRSLRAAIARAVRSWHSAIPTRFTLREDTDGFVTREMEYVPVDRVFKAYVTGPFRVEDVRMLAQEIASVVPGAQEAIWVQLWDDAEGSSEIASFEILYGQVREERAPR